MKNSKKTDKDVKDLKEKDAGSLKHKDVKDLKEKDAVSLKELDREEVSNTLSLELQGDGWNVNYTSVEPIAGFQFDVDDGATINGVGGGAAVDAGFNIEHSLTTVIGFSLAGNTIPPGNGTLVALDLDLDGTLTGLSGIVMSDPDANAMNFKFDEGSSSVPSTEDFVDENSIGDPLSTSSTGWEGSSGWTDGGVYTGPHVSTDSSTPDGDGYYVRNYQGDSASDYAITKVGEDTITSEERGNIKFTMDWASNTILGARFVAIVNGEWYGSAQIGTSSNDHGNMDLNDVTDWEVGVSVNADNDNWYVSLAGAPDGYDWRDGNQWNTSPVSGGGLPSGDIDQFGIAWLHEGNYHYGAVDNFIVSSSGDVQGCMESTACNYNADATVDDGSCDVLDDCGVCGGPGENTCPDGSLVCDVANCPADECVNDDSTSDSYGDTCTGWYDAYALPGSYGCTGGYDDDDFTAATQCCACQGEPPTCAEQGLLDDCSGDGDCFSDSWLGDGFCDGVDQPYGADLTCYDNDGGDCEPPTCAEQGLWDCGDGQCITNGYVCDGSSEFCNAGWGPDCANGADEGLALCGYADECVADVQGCMESTACNYNADATVDDGSCDVLDDCGVCGGPGENTCPDGSLVCDVANCPADECVNDDSTSDSYGDTCTGWYDAYALPGSYGCTGGYDDDDFTAATQCCACQGEPPTCAEQGLLDDCSGDGDCFSDSWLGDGFCDGVDQPYGADLTCYDNDGGDCDASVDGCMESTACNYNADATVDDGSCDVLDDCGVCGGPGENTCPDGSLVCDVANCVATPSISIVYPMEGEVIEGTSVVVVMSSENVVIGSEPGEHHYHASLNGEFNQMFYEDNLPLNGMVNDTYTLSVSLANSDHEEIDGAVDDVTFTTTQPSLDPIALSFGTYAYDSVEILMTNTESVAGFQFSLSGAIIIDAFDGSAEAAGFIVSASETTVLGFNLSGGVIQAGGEQPLTLTNLTVGSVVDELCLVGVVFSDSAAEAMSVTVGDCLVIDTSGMPGCMDDTACNYNADATDDDGSCTLAVEGYDCDNNCLADSDNDGVCDADEIAGCQDDTACDYDSTATDAGDCTYAGTGLDCDGICLDDADGDEVCDADEIAGCQDDTACDYDSTATDAGDCTYAGTGLDCDGICLDDADGDEVCDADEIVGCQDEAACNYDADATDAGDCTFAVAGYDCDENCIVDADADGICDANEIAGCQDVSACNYNEDATDDDGSCTHPETDYDCAGDCIIATDCAGECGGTAANCPDWVDTAANYQFTASMTASVKNSSNGEALGDDGDILAAFGEAGEVRGIGFMQDGLGSSDGLTFHAITIRSNVGSDEISFQYYDASLDEVLPSSTSYAFVSNDVIGSLFTPYEITVGKITQIIEINSGWNSISVNVEGDNMSLDHVLSNLSPEVNDIIKDQNDFAQYYGEEYGWVGVLEEIDPTSMYMLYMSNAGSLEFSAPPAPVDTQISLVDGWNWIGYLPQDKMLINDALGTVDAELNDIIKDQNYFAQYYGEEYGGWVGVLEKMSPGVGYQLSVSTGSELIYPDLDRDSEPSELLGEIF